MAGVTVVFTIALWMRLLGAVASGWLADRVGRDAPLMASILCYSVCITRAIPMPIGKVAGLVGFILAVICGPETTGKVLVADLVVT